MVHVGIASICKARIELQRKRLVLLLNPYVVANAYTKIRYQFIFANHKKKQDPLFLLPSALKPGYEIVQGLFIRLRKLKCWQRQAETSQRSSPSSCLASPQQTMLSNNMCILCMQCNVMYCNSMQRNGMKWTVMSCNACMFPV